MSLSHLGDGKVHDVVLKLSPISRTDEAAAEQEMHEGKVKEGPEVARPTARSDTPLAAASTATDKGSLTTKADVALAKKIAAAQTDASSFCGLVYLRVQLKFDPVRGL